MLLGYANHPRRDVLAEIRWIGENGFDFVDLYLEPDRAAAENVDPDAIREALDRYDLDVTGHLAWYLPIGSAMCQLRRAAIDVASVYLDVFARIGVCAVTVHANWPPGIFSPEEGIAWQIESLCEIVRIAADAGVSVMYEPIDGPLDTTENIERILSGVAGLFLHLDLGHANLHGRSPVRMTRHFGQRIRHIHLNDNNGRADLHLPAGCGAIEWKAVAKVLHEIGYDRTVTIEVFSRDRDYVLLCRQKIEALLAAR